MPPVVVVPSGVSPPDDRPSLVGGRVGVVAGVGVAPPALNVNAGLYRDGAIEMRRFPMHDTEGQIAVTVTPYLTIGGRAGVVVVVVEASAPVEPSGVAGSAEHARDMVKQSGRPGRMAWEHSSHAR